LGHLLFELRNNVYQILIVIN